MLEDGALTSFVEERYAGWNGGSPEDARRRARSIGDRGMRASADINPQPVSGRQEYLENVVNRYV
jgi:xylose isomerase